MTLEKRTYNRFTCDAPIWILCLDTEDLIDAHAINCSVKGLYFKSDYQFKPQSPVCIMRKNFELSNYHGMDCEGIPEHSLAEIRWNMETSTSQTSYEIGVEYAAPYLLTPTIIQRTR
jgi:hypothetical protein